MLFYETSAMESTNVVNGFTTLAQTAMNKYLEKKSKREGAHDYRLKKGNSNVIKLNQKKHEKEGQKIKKKKRKC